jgi:hypothetical protein
MESIRHTQQHQVSMMGIVLELKTVNHMHINTHIYKKKKSYFFSLPIALRARMMASSSFFFLLYSFFFARLFSLSLSLVVVYHIYIYIYIHGKTSLHIFLKKRIISRNFQKKNKKENKNGRINIIENFIHLINEAKLED